MYACPTGIADMRLKVSDSVYSYILSKVLSNAHSIDIMNHKANTNPFNSTFSNRVEKQTDVLLIITCQLY